MGRYSFLALDLDGTLLMPDLTVPRETAEALRAAKDRGAVITIATGRMYQTAASYAKLLGIEKSPLISYNGSVIKTGEGLSLCESGISEKTQKDIIEFCLKNEWYIQTYNNDSILVSRYDEHTRADLDTLQNPVIEVGSLLESELDPSPKMTSKCLDGSALKRVRAITEAFGHLVEVTLSGGDVVEILPKGVSKARALELAAGYCGVSPDMAAACGDSENDTEMLKSAGLGCAMANASPDLKQIADYVCENEYSFGVLEVIERFFL
jgi:Cof subfamily protein (haloacid dehalogenase superfamily)